MKLTIKQKRFADEYIISGNATESYLKAGYANQKRSSAEANARKLLGNSSLKSYMNERIKELDDKAIAKQEEVLKYLTSVMRGEHEEEVLYGMGEGMQGKTHIEVSAKDRIKAAELLGKRYRLFTDKVELDADVDMELNVKVDYGD